MKVKGALWNTLGSTLYGLNSFIMLALVGRLGAVEETGVFGIAFTTAQLLYIVGLFGMSHFQMTDYGKTYCFSDYKKARVCSSGLMLVVCGLTIVCLGFTGEKAYLTVMLCVLMLLNVVGDLYQNLFFRNNRLDLSGSALFYRTLWPLITFASTYLLTERLILAVVLQILCNLATTLYYICRVAPPFFREEEARSKDGRTAWTLLVDCFPLFISLLLMNLLINTSKYGIEFLMDDTAQGYYNMLFIPAQVINLCSQFIFKPMLNQYAVLLQARDRKGVCTMLGRQLALVAGFTGVCCVGAGVLGVPVLGLIYQKNLSGYTLALVWIVVGGGIFATCQLFYYIFVILRKQREILITYLTVSVCSLPITYGLVQWRGVIGAAWSFAAIHGVLLTVYLWRFLREVSTMRTDGAA